jgi:general secretion pathway protein G
MWEGPHVYGGVRSVGRYGDLAGDMLSYCDLPFSFALDTGFLPVTSLAELSRWVTGWPPFSHRLYRDQNPDLTAKLKVARQDISTLTTALGLYRAWRGAYPASDPGLNALYRRPGAEPPEKWDGIYLTGEGPQSDPWGRPYVYRFPGVRNPKGYDLFSSGPDRIPDTDDDIEEK